MTRTRELTPALFDVDPPRLTIVRDAVPHPAKFSAAILETIRELLDGSEGPILDPFAGTGRVHGLREDTWGVEIEPRWAALHPRTVQGDALRLPFRDNSFGAVVTSPTYGNRMADHHNAKDGSKRNTYRHVYGENLHPNNSGQLQWGDQYRDFHQQAWREAGRVLQPGGKFILNISDHVRRGVVVPVSDWHVATLQMLGFELVASSRVATRRQRMGANSDLRVNGEWVHMLRLNNAAEKNSNSRVPDTTSDPAFE